MPSDTFYDIEDEIMDLHWDEKDNPKFTTISKEENTMTEGQLIAEAIGSAWYMGRQTAIQKMRYDNRFINTSLKRSYAAGFISGMATVDAIRATARPRVIVSTVPQAI